MTGQVDFYILDGSGPALRHRYACRVVERAWQHGLRVAVLAGDDDELRALDDLLWTFSDQSFVPHGIRAAGADAAIPVQLMRELPDDDDVADMLVNLAPRLPPRAQRFARIAEVVDGDPELRRLGRERFKAYRDLQLTLKAHQIDETGEA